MSDYNPRGFSVWYRQNTVGIVEQVNFQFEGAVEYRAMVDWAIRQGFYQQPNAVEHSHVFGAGAKNPSRNGAPPVCPVHGGRRWVKPNKGHGSHRFYCAHKNEGGGYCGKKIQ